MKKNLFQPLIFVLGILLPFFNAHAQFKYPEARQHYFDTVIYNKKISDEYAWMSLPEHQIEMQEFARQHGKLTENILDNVTGSEIIGEINKKISQSNSTEEISLYGTQGNTMYYYKWIDEKKQYHLMTRKGFDGIEETITDTSFIVNGKIYTIKKSAFAFNKPLVAMMMVESGESNPHIRFYDLNKKLFLADSLGPVMFNDASGVSMAWLPDDSGIIYSQTPPGNSPEEKYYRGILKIHLIGTDTSTDSPIFGKGVIDVIELQDHETPYIYSFLHSPYIIARIRAGKGDNYAFAVHYKKLNGSKTRGLC